MKAIFASILDQLTSLLNYSLMGWLRFFDLTGYTVPLILVLTLIGSAIILEKFLALRSSAVFIDDYEDALVALERDSEKQIDQEIQFLAPPQARLITLAQKYRSMDKVDLRRELRQTSESIYRYLTKRVAILESLAKICPLLGLLGSAISLVQLEFSANASSIIWQQQLNHVLLPSIIGISTGIFFIIISDLLQKKGEFYSQKFQEINHEIVKAIHYGQLKFTSESENSSASE